MERLAEVWAPLEAIWIPQAVINNSLPILPKKDDGYPFLLETEMVVGELEPATQALFGKLFETSEFERALGLIRNQFDFNNDGIRGADGHIFSLLCYILLREEQRQKGVRVVSPGNIEAIFEQLYPERMKFNFNGWGLGIDGITIPDGVFVKCMASKKAAAIVGICEYTLRRPDDPVKEKQREHYRNPDFVIEDFFPGGSIREFGVRLSQRIRRKFNFWGILQMANREDLQFINVYPRQECQETKGELRSSESERFVPFTREEFNKVMNAIFTDVENARFRRLYRGV